MHFCLSDEIGQNFFNTVEAIFKYEVVKTVNSTGNSKAISLKEGLLNTIQSQYEFDT